MRRLVAGCLALGAVAAVVIAVGMGGVGTALTNNPDSQITINGSEPFVIPASEQAVVSGTTKLAPETRVSIRFQSTDQGTPFVKSSAATVADDGGFETTFDLSELSSERTVQISVQADDYSTERSGRIVAPENGFGGTEEEASAEVTLPEEPVELTASENATLSGSTVAEPGSELTVRLKHADSDTPFVKGTSTTVETDQSFTATFDLSDRLTERETTIRISNGNWTTTTPGTVIAPPDGFPDVENATVSLRRSEPLVLDMATNQTIAGSTNLDSGTELDIRLSDTDGMTPRLLERSETTVGAGGNFTGEFDLASVDQERNITVEVVAYRTTLSEFDGEITDSSN